MDKEIGSGKRNRKTLEKVLQVFRWVLISKALTRDGEKWLASGELVDLLMIP